MKIEIKRRPKMEPRGTLTLRGQEEEEELEKETGKEQSEVRRKTKKQWYLGSPQKEDSPKRLESSTESNASEIKN